MVADWIYKGGLGFEFGAVSLPELGRYQCLMGWKKGMDMMAPDFSEHRELCRQLWEKVEGKIGIVYGGKRFCEWKIFILFPFFIPIMHNPFDFLVLIQNPYQNNC